MSPSAPLPSSPREQLRQLVRTAPLYAILDAAVRPELPPESLAAALLAAGTRLLQYRHKQRWGRQHYAACCRLAEQVHQAGGLFLVNDRADVAALCGADGVHLGQHDLPPDKARGFLGPDKLIGYSTHNRAQVSLAAALPVDYIAVGPVFPTSTKQHPDPVVGLSLIREARALTELPLVAIGGITLENAAAVLQAGADAVAIISDLVRDTAIESRVRRFLEALPRGDVPGGAL